MLPDTSRDTIQAAIVGVGASILDDLMPESRERVLEAVTGAIRDVWTQALAAAILSLVLSLTMRREKVNTSDT